MIWEVKIEVRLFRETKKDWENDDQLKNQMESRIVMKEEEGTKEGWWFEKWNGKCECYDRIRRIKITMINWEVNRKYDCYERRRRIKKWWEIEKENMKCDCHQKRRNINRTMINWEVKWEM
jgi:hypothetical protein